jgi:hypothetical protein
MHAAARVSRRGSGVVLTLFGMSPGGCRALKNIFSFGKKSDDE